MALKVVLAADVPMLNQVPEMPVVAAAAVQISMPAVARSPERTKGFVVVGHRGKGMNSVASLDRRMWAVRENSLLSFNQVGRFLVEFDIQVTKDDCPIIFHDDVILTEEAGIVSERRITDLSLEEFLSYGHQREAGKVGKPLLRRAKDGRVLNWNVEIDDSLCTLEEAFLKVDSHLGFNIELKFDDHAARLPRTGAYSCPWVCLGEYANGRPIIFSTFQPDAAQLLRKLQCVYPVFFLTEAGAEISDDARRNSLDEAIKLCLESGLHGIVSEVRGVLRDPSAVTRIKESNLALLTYGQLNNIPEAIYVQHLMGTNGVIVDFVEEITEAVSDFTTPVTKGNESSCNSTGEEAMNEATRPNFSQRELSFLLKLMSQLIQH